MIPKELKALIDEHCMGVKDINKVDPEIVTRIMDEVERTKADAAEVQKYMDEVIKGPTKAEREAAAKAEAERKAKEAAERAERERLAAIERAKREKEEAERKAKKAAEREKKEALFKELKKKYPAADISGIGHILIYDKPIDQWETIFKASARQQTLNKVKNILYWVVFSILLIGAFVCEHLFVHGGWSTFLVVALILAAFGTSGYYRSRGKGDHEDIFAVNTWCAGILWQHYFVHGFWWTTLAIVVIFLIPFIFNYKKHIKLARVVTWIIGVFVAACFALLLFTNVKIVDTPKPTATETIETNTAPEPSQSEFDDYYTSDEEGDFEPVVPANAAEEYERAMQSAEEEYERAMQSAEEEYDRIMQAAEEEFDRILNRL